MKLIKPTFVISRDADSLTEALKESPQTVTVWVRSGKFKNRFPLIRSTITYEAKSNADAKEYTKKFVATLPIPKTHIRLSVLKGITKHQIVQLLAYTKKDKLIKTFTHDVDRFKSKRTFTSWRNRRKIIYTLIDRKGKLLGIIWFDKKQFKNYKYTFAIRVYPPVRGKKIARHFLATAYGNFKIRRKNPNLWLRTVKENAKALKLYRHFGFKVTSEDSKNNEVLMTFRT